MTTLSGGAGGGGCTHLTTPGGAWPPARLRRSVGETAPAGQRGNRMAAFGDRLRLLREERGLTRVQLAAAAGLTRQGVQRLEVGERANPSWDTVCRLAAALDVSLDAFRAPPAGGGADEG